MDDLWAAEIGERLKAARKAAAMSRKDVGDAIGRNEETIASYEQGSRAPFKEIRQIAEATNADLRELLHGDSYVDPLEQINAKLDVLLSRLPDAKAEVEREIDEALQLARSSSQGTGASARSRRRQGKAS